MKIAFNPFRLVSGGIQVVTRIKTNIEKADQDGKIDRHELGSIILSGLVDIATVLAAAMSVDDKPIFPSNGGSTDDG